MGCYEPFVISHATKMSKIWQYISRDQFAQTIIWTIRLHFEEWARTLGGSVVMSVTEHAVLLLSHNKEEITFQNIFRSLQIHRGRRTTFLSRAIRHHWTRITPTALRASDVSWWRYSPLVKTVILPRVTLITDPTHKNDWCILDFRVVSWACVRPGGSSPSKRIPPLQTHDAPFWKKPRRWSECEKMDLGQVLTTLYWSLSVAYGWRLSKKINQNEWAGLQLQMSGNPLQR